MKRLLCILFAMLLCACTVKKEPASTDPTVEEDPGFCGVIVDTDTDYEIPDIKGYHDFMKTLSAALVDGTQNRNLSPISVYLALALAAEGANGETQADMLKLLGCASLEELRGVCGAMLEALSTDTEDSTLEIADSI